MRRLLWVMVAAACTVEGGKDVPLVVGEGPVSVDPATQKVTLDTSKVPTLSTCGPKQVVRRSAAGDAWECADAEVAWTRVLNPPATFAPSAHTHTASQITDLAGALAGLSVPGNFVVSGSVQAGGGVEVADGQQLAWSGGSPFISGSESAGLAVSTGGADRLRVDPTGVVTIGDTSTDASTDFLFRVAGGAQAAFFAASRYPRIIGMQSVSDITVNTNNVYGWADTPGATAGSKMQVLLTADGPDDVYLVAYTLRFTTATAGENWSAITVLNAAGSDYKWYLGDGVQPTANWAASSSVHVTGLPAGSYTIRLRDWHNATENRSYISQRQLLVYRLR